MNILIMSQSPPLHHSDLSHIHFNIIISRHHDNVKEVVMIGYIKQNRQKYMLAKFYFEYMNERDHLEDQDLRVRIVLKSSYIGLDSSGLV
jgi:hypothetical protein